MDNVWSTIVLSKEGTEEVCAVEASSWSSAYKELNAQSINEYGKPLIASTPEDLCGLILQGTFSSPRSFRYAAKASYDAIERKLADFCEKCTLGVPCENTVQQHNGNDNTCIVLRWLRVFKRGKTKEKPMAPAEVSAVSALEKICSKCPNYIISEKPFECITEQCQLYNLFNDTKIFEPNT